MAVMSCDVLFFYRCSRQPSEPKKTRLCLPEAQGSFEGISWIFHHPTPTFGASSQVINRKIFKDIAGGCASNGSNGTSPSSLFKPWFYSLDGLDSPGRDNGRRRFKDYCDLLDEAQRVTACHWLGGPRVCSTVWGTMDDHGDLVTARRQEDLTYT